MSRETKNGTKSFLLALVLAGLGVAGFSLGLIRDTRHALLAWTSAYAFGLWTALGAMVLVMVLYVTGARWWLLVAPLLRAMIGTIPLFALLFLPIAIGAGRLYPWANEPEGLSPVMAEALEHQRSWNQPTFFYVRSAIYLVVWVVMSIVLRRAETDESPEGQARLRAIGGASLPILALTMTFASFDWLMALEPGWSSTMYGVYVFASGFLGALSLLAVLAWAADRRGHLDATLAPDHTHAVGRLMLMAVILWAYVGFFQFMLIWIADLPREVSFFTSRAHGPFGAIDALLLFGRFVLPFLALLSRSAKRHPLSLAVLAGWLVLMTALDFAWLGIGAIDPHLTILDLAPFLVVGAISFAYGAHRFGAERRVIPTASTQAELRESLRYRSP
ncbi:hypothetical protein AKJ09_04176 [Labilithrix luteola]|uniref:Quinol:cytochrome c oxidoreductase quinone-binding subunit 2 n=1 Tax=Labilithrix luteola TaxID=1391654 RepID=A0A0K1PVF6_9BACT|nr:hypothetical protein [Labilithrix luteola]AKU97512.1 hypothetical protein AKJ09_04176 [Labilithrix luteola]